jgi:hypothetical protein
MKTGKIFIAGLLISGAAAFQIGILNISAFQVFITKGTQSLLYFIIGCLMMQVVHIRISLSGMQLMMKYEKIFRLFNWLSLILTVLMSISFIMASVNHGIGNERGIFINDTPPFILGFLLMMVNVSRIPFWYGWNTALFVHNILVPESRTLNRYIAGICIGCFTGYLLFISLSKFVFVSLHANIFTVNGLIGSVLALSAIFNYFKMRSHDPDFTHGNSL